MDPSIEALLEQASTGQVSLEALRWRLVPEQERTILARAALVHAFDAALLEAVLSQGLEPVPWKQLVASPFVERVPTLEGFFRVRERARRTQLQQWTGQSPVEDDVPRSLEEFRRLSLLLAEYYAQLGPEWKGEQLYHLWAVTPDAARSLFEELFTEAEHQFDIGRCHDLLERLTERSVELPAQHELRQLAEDYKPRFEARALWSDEYYRSARLQERPDLLEEVEGLLGDSQRWILQIFATGGLGKTSFLWWLIARYFVPRGIACARIDFDDVRRGADEPWRLILQLVRQLKVQIRGPDLERLEYELLSFERANSGPSSSSADAQYSRELSERLAYGLLESGNQAPVVLIFDTLEEALLHRGTALVTLLEHLSSVLHIFPRLKVVLSGRYDLRERIDELETKFGPELRSLEVTPFTAHQAREYLTVRRGFTQDDARAEAVLRKAEGVPFKLSLLADHVQRTGATAEEIASFPAADMLYLIKRVVERIEDPQVRWLLRYGVIPRKLTFSFVEEVMARHLPSAMAGISSLDDPRWDKLPSQPFRTDLLVSPEEPVDLRELWKRLTRYASDYGWVRRVLGPQDTLVFHENVVNPMRRLLQEQKVFRQLHKEAAELYERKADSAANPRWIDAILEAIYHRFQWQGVDAEPFWRSQLEQARAERKVGWRLELAKEILGSEYLDSDNQPRLRRDGKLMVSAAALLEANLELAEASLEQLPTLEDRSGRIREAQAAIAWANRLKEESSPRVGIDTRLAVAEALLALEAGDSHHALNLVQTVSMADRRQEDQLKLRMIEVDALRAQHRNPLPALAAVQELIYGGSAEVRPGRLVWLSAGLSAWDQHADAISTAKDAARISEAANPERSGTSLEDSQRGRLRWAEAHLLAGQPGAAEQLLNELKEPSHEAQLLAARVSLAQGLPSTALAQLLRTRVENFQRGSPVRRQELALTGQLIASAHARLLHFNEATAGFEGALDLWRKTDGTEGYDRCLREYVAFLIREVGDYHAARQFLDRRRSGRTHAVGPEAVRLALLEAELLAAEKQPSRALYALTALSQIQEFSPGLQARVELEYLVLGHEPARHIERLEEQLLKVQTVSARLVILRSLRRVPQLPAVAATRLLRLLPLEGKLHPEDLERAVMRRAELHRFTGDARVRDELGEMELEPTRLEFWRELTLLQDRLGWPADHATAWREAFEYYEREDAPNRLVGALLLEEVERRLQFGGAVKDFERSKNLLSLLDSARDHLGTGERLSRWDLRFVLARAAVMGEAEDLIAAESIPIRARLGLPQAGPTRSSSARELQIRLTADETDGLAVEVSWPGAHPQSLRTQGLFTEVLSRSAAAIPHDAIRSFTSDWREAARELGLFLLRNTDSRLADFQSPIDLRLRTHPFCHAMPWELALFRTQALTLGLLPAIYGIARDLDRGTQPVETAPRSGPEQGRIVLVAPHGSVERAQAAFRYEHLYGRDLFRISFDLSAEALHSSLWKGDSPLGLLHLSVEMTEAAHGGPALSLGRHPPVESNAMRSTSEELTPSLLCSVLSQLPAHSGRPVVVLDVARPRGITEQLRQVFLRNVFAAELFGLGFCSAVLCIGLAEVKFEGEMAEVLTTNLLSGESLGATSQRLRQVALKVIGSRGVEQVSLEEILGPASTALFAADPHFRPFAREPEKL
jgi:hypothetical protein